MSGDAPDVGGPRLSRRRAFLLGALTLVAAAGQGYELLAGRGDAWTLAYFAAFSLATAALALHLFRVT